MCLEFKEGPLVDGLLCCVWYLFIKWGLARAVCGWRLHMWRGGGGWASHGGEGAGGVVGGSRGMGLRWVVGGGWGCGDAMGES